MEQPVLTHATKRGEDMSPACDKQDGPGSQKACSRFLCVERGGTIKTAENQGRAQRENVLYLFRTVTQCTAEGIVNSSIHPTVHIDWFPPLSIFFRNEIRER